MLCASKMRNEDNSLILSPAIDCLSYCTFNWIDCGQKTPLSNDEALVDSVTVDVHEAAVMSVRSEIRGTSIMVSPPNYYSRFCKLFLYIQGILSLSRFVTRQTSRQTAASTAPDPRTGQWQ